MSEHTPGHLEHAHETGRGFGRVLVFVYGVLAFAATGRASFELVAKFSEAPVPYALSVLAALVYIVATWALATNRRGVALVAVCFELVGVLAVGFSSLLWTSKFPEASVWSDFGIGYGCVPLVLPIVGLWWLLRGSR
jgi:cytochrome bd-type quinol oxidase subunit 2